MADLSSEIETNAQGPKQVTADGLTVEQHSLPDQIAAEQHLKSKDAIKKKHRGLRFTRLSPPEA
ncbi:MAG: hypothetical protein KatS3mg105_3291 [Gemmatales bacterium]|nr:MAG: hypothetical protein KatS3mg105_0592 [Gemmatales bacterium]GIW81484.1 MAG: hypothetical protein KatS3mg105_3291 [Gemmatales bacterium]